VSDDHRDDLTMVHVQSGTAQDGPEEYRGFCTVFCTAKDGFRMIGQLDPADVRKMALNFLSAAEAAEQDAVVMTMMVRDLHAPTEIAAKFVTAMREVRVEIHPDPEGDDLL
jgi:hypothetical protein